MTRAGKGNRYLGVVILTTLLASVVAAQTAPVAKLLPTTRQAPDEFGIQDYTVTTISAFSFTPSSDNIGTGWPAFYAYPPLYGLVRYSDANIDQHYYTTVNVPSGAVIDFIGLESSTDTAGILGVALWLRDRFGTQTLVATFSSSIHSWDTDYNTTPIGFQLVQNVHNELVLDVEQAPSPTGEFFGWVEVWWHRTVSPAPSVASFVDVPTTSPIFRFVEALKASGITAGCDATHYCPNNPLTRGQMAVFLSAGLGLHWPY